jgi:prepilin-type processing-associated H-X9-DG protein
MNRYLGADGKNGFGVDYLRCPTQEEDCHHTYGRNYNNIWWSATGNDYLPMRLEQVRGNWYLMADSHNRNWGASWMIHDYSILTARSFRPAGGFGGWAPDTDFDGDGVLDSFGGVLTTFGPYNGLGAWHLGRTANFSFSDGRVENMTVNDWVANHNGINTQAYYYFR